MLTQEQILDICKMDDLPFDMRPRQLEAINAFIDGNNVAIFLPTGYGKTLPAKLAAKYMWETQGKKTILIGLLKALTAEQFESFSEIMPTIIDDGDHRQKTDTYDDKEWVLACMTPEKFDSIMSKPKKRDTIMRDVGLIITDEAHTIGDTSRGHRMENYLITTRKCYPEMKYMYLSATVGNPTEFSKWLESTLVIATAEERPVPLELKIMPYREIMFPWNDEIPDFKANYNLKLEMLQDLIEQADDDCWITFVTARNRTVQIANALAGIRGYNTLHRLVEEFGIAYHHGGLTKEDRKYVEDAFRTGVVNKVIATPTLAVGVNLPADRCVIFDTEQYSLVHGNQPLNANRIQQTMGRAGRPNLSDKGYAYILVPERLEEIITDRALNPLIVSSKLKPRLHEKALQWIAGGNARDVIDIYELCESSYSDIDMNETFAACEWLKAFGFIKEIEGAFALTSLGYNTNQMYVMPETVVAWQSQIENIKDPENFKEIYVRFGSVPEYHDVVTVREEDSTLIGYGRDELGRMFPNMKERCENRLCLTCLTKHTCFEKEFNVSNCEMFEHDIPAFIKEELLKCYFITFYDDLAEKYLPKKYNNRTGKKETKHLPISNGDRKLLKEAGSRMFAAASVIFNKHKKLSNTLKTISIMAEAGTLQKELVELVKLKLIGLKRAKKLYDYGIETIGDFISSTPKEIAAALGVSQRVATGMLSKNMDLF